MSKRGNSEVPSDRERAFAATVEETGDFSNVSSSSNSDTVSSAHDHDPHESLLTVGEKCVHLICAFFREFDCEGNSHGVKTSKGAVTLSRLSRTCRALYVYVRNLPSVLESAVPPFSTHLLPWGTIGLDLGYWCDIAGLVWEVSDPRQLLSLTAPTPTDDPHELSETTSNQDIKQSDVRLGNLFLHLHNLSGTGTLTSIERAESVRILEQCGGLSFSVHDRFDPVASLGLDLKRCKNLRYLHVSVDLQRDAAFKRYETILNQLSAMDENPQYASITMTGAEMLTDLSALSSFQSVRAFSAINLTSLEGVEHARFVDMRNLTLADVSALANVHTVELTQCNYVSDVSTLRAVHNLMLYDCESVTDVSMLGNVHTLCFVDCHGITDVSALSTVRELDIRFCDGVTNLAALPNLSHHVNAAVDLNGDLSTLRSVDLSYRNDVTDVSMLGHVHALNLAGCRSITNVSMLDGVHTLSLARCTALRNVSMLGSVHTLNLSGCSRVTDVSMLGGVHTLDLSRCMNMTDVSALGGVHTLSLAGCKRLTDVSPLATVHRLNLSFCNGITDVSSLHSVTYLRLILCRKVTNASTLINRVPYLVY